MALTNSMMTSSNGYIFRVTGHLCRSPVNSPHKGQWRGALMFSFIWVWINGWVNNHEAGDLRHYRTHYDVTVMSFIWVWNVVVTSLTAMDSHNLFAHICHGYFTDTGAMVHLQKSWLWNWQIQTYKKITSKKKNCDWKVREQARLRVTGRQRNWDIQQKTMFILYRRSLDTFYPLRVNFTGRAW